MKPIVRQTLTVVIVCLVPLWMFGQMQQKTEENYSVIHIDRDRVYINAGSDQGAYIGMIVTLHEPIKWQDKKGKIIEDYIPFSYAALKHVGNQFSIFTTDSATLRLLQKGSVVRLGPVLPRTIVEAQKVESLPKPEPSKTEQLKTAETTTARKDEKPGKAETKKEERQFTYSLSEFRFGEPLYFQLYIPPSISKAEVRIRRQGEISYTVLQTRSEEPSLFIGRVDKDFHQDKNVEYFIKGTGADNEELILAGNPAKPLVAIAPVRKEQDAKGKPEEFVPVRLGFLHTPSEGAVLYKKLAMTVYAPPPMKTPKLRYRVKGKVEYKEIVMTAKPNDFYFFEIPEDEVAEPAVQYYITVSKPNGEEVLVIGNPDNPQTVPVSGFVINPSIELQKYGGNRSKLQALVETASFGERKQLGITKDEYTHFQVDYMYRIFALLYSIRMGMGAFQGTSYLQDPSTSIVTTVPRNFYYGYVESEFRIPQSSFSVITKFLTGINDDGIGSGFEGKLRLGDELGVNLVTALWTASKLGSSASVQLNVPLTDRSGFAGAIAVEDLPAKGDTGFRMAVDYRYRILDDLDVNARLGMGARTTEAVGANLGLGFILHF